MKKVALIAALALSACAHGERAVSATPVPDWRRVATDADRSRLAQWRTAFVDGLDQAKASGHAAEIAREGRLLEPDAGMAGGRPPAGDYRCRVIKLGAKAKSDLAYVTYPPFSCRIDDEGGIATFRKTTGSQRPVGVILGGGQKLVFLGTLVLGDEKRAIDYGRDADRDMIGAIESLGDGRWRLILPYPHYESVTDVIELVPASPRTGS